MLNTPNSCFLHARRTKCTSGHEFQEPFPRSRSRISPRDCTALFLGVSPQTVYLWVERKQIPHLRVMGRNIRFLQSDLEPFRATFKQEVGFGTTNKA